MFCELSVLLKGESFFPFYFCYIIQEYKCLQTDLILLRTELKKQNIRSVASGVTRGKMVIYKARQCNLQSNCSELFFRQPF